MTKKYPKLHDVDWLRKAIETTPLRKVAASLGCSYSAVVRATRQYGLIVPIRRTYDVSVDKSAISKVAYKKRWPNGRHGKDAANWRGGRQKTKFGYVYIHMPDHPDATKQGYVMEHRLVAEKMLGRRLKKGEVPHHRNGIKTDNRPENLQVMTRSEHVQLHFDALKEVFRLRAILDEHGIEYEKEV